MKKALLLMAAAFICSVSNAQIISSTSSEIAVTKVEKPKSKNVHYLQIGVSSLGMTGDGVPNIVGSTIGFDFLYGYEKPLGTSGVWWGMEAGLGSGRGFGYSTDVNGIDVDCKYHTYAVRYSPLNFGYRYNFANGLSLEGHLGAGVSIDFAGDETVTMTKGSQTKEKVVSIWDFDDYMPIDVYLKVGVGVSYKAVGVDLSWQKGFLDNQDGAKATASNVVFSLRYNF